LRELPAVETLRRVWLQNYLRTPDGVRWRRSKEEGLPPASQRIDSPTDVDSRRASKGELRWVGYKVHLTETCDDDAPRIVTHVETATAPTPDRKAVRAVHEALKSKTLLPSTHLVDMGYTDASALLEARDVYGVDLLGPMRSNYEWYAREGTGFDLASFEIDWEKEEATCPEGKKSIHWRRRTRRGQPVLGIAFSPKDCGEIARAGTCASAANVARARDVPTGS
jgi:transposase